MKHVLDWRGCIGFCLPDDRRRTNHTRWRGWGLHASKPCGILIEENKSMVLEDHSTPRVGYLTFGSGSEFGASFS
jgi:hypothetical protein